MEKFFNDYRGALITGASSGIGMAYAERLAGLGLDLILVARSTDKLDALARKLRREGCRAEVVSQDLALANPGRKLAGAVDGLGIPVDLLINNAGFGTVGPFHKQSAAREAQEVKLNALAVLDLCHAFLPAMVERGRGSVINVASVAAFQAMPYMAVYGATKAFVLSLSEALRAEYRAQGIGVQCLCPGPVDTGFFEATGNRRLRSAVPKRAMMTPERVVERSLRALQRGESVVIPGPQNQAMAWISKIAPRDMLAAVTARVMKR